MKRYLLVIGTDEFSGAGRITKFFKDSLKKQKIGFLSYLYIGNSSKQKKQNFKNFQVSKFNKFLNFFKIIFKIFKNKKKIKALVLIGLVILSYRNIDRLIKENNINKKI